VRGQLEAGRGDRETSVVDRLKSRASYRTVPIFPALERDLVSLLERELAAGRGRAFELVFCTRRGGPVSQRNVAQRGVMKAASNAGLGHITPQDLRRSFCSLAGRRGVDPVEAPQLTGHSPEVWARYYARSFREGAARRGARACSSTALASSAMTSSGRSADTALIFPGFGRAQEGRAA